MASPRDCDVLIFGGGIAGMWALDALRRAGHGALLVESASLGAGQTIQSQGIVHGGGKYALRGVSDLEAVRAISAMPARWLACLEGKSEPDLRAARLASRSCLLWAPKSGFFGDLASKGLMSLVVGAGLLATKPVEMEEKNWPEALRGSALKAWSMAEPVLDVGSVLAALLERNRGHVRRSASVRFSGGIVHLDGVDARPRAVVLAAGAGNEGLFAQFGERPSPMQRRPLTMFLVRGPLPDLWGHCVVGGKTHLTITTVKDRAGRKVWQVGGEVAERTAGTTDLAAARAEAAAELKRFLPNVDLAHAEISTYAAVRAEAATAGARRPSGVHVEKIRDNPPVLVCWPTKLALAPLLADDLVAQLPPSTGKFDPELGNGPVPAVATPPWEEAKWFPAP